jgi:ubiquitin-like protein ATG12
MEPPTPTPADAKAVEAAPKPADVGVKVHLKAIGTAPVLKKSKFKVNSQERFATIITFLRRQLALGGGDTLFCYLHSAFAPSPSVRIEDLFRSFHSEGELVVHYSLSNAFG